MNYGFNLKRNDLIQGLESNARFEFNLYKNKVFLTGDASAVEKFYKEDWGRFQALDKYAIAGKNNAFWYNVQYHNARVFFGLIKMINDAFVKLITSGGLEAKVKVQGKNYDEDTEYDEEQTQRLDDILQFNDFYDKKWGLAESYQSGLGYVPLKISIDESLSDKPIVEATRPERTEVMEKRGIIQGYKFKRRKQVGDEEYEIQEIVKYGQDEQPLIEYRVLFVDGEDTRDVAIGDLTQDTFEALGLDMLIVDGKLQTVFDDYSELSDLPVILKNNTPHNSMFPTAPFGEPDTQGLDTIEDALSELVSSMVEEIRKGRIKVLISEDLVSKDKNGMSQGFNEFRMDYEVMDNDANNDTKIQVVQGTINSEKYLSGLSSLISFACNKANLHPITVGITGVESIDASQESQMEREKVSMRTRETKLKSWRQALKKLFNLLLQTQDIMDGKPVQEYDITLNFGNFSNPSQENVINLLSKAVEGSILSTREAQKEYHQNDLTDEEYEINYIRTLIERGDPLTPAQRFFYEQKTQEQLGVTDEQVASVTRPQGIEEE